MLKLTTNNPIPKNFDTSFEEVETIFEQSLEKLGQMGDFEIELLFVENEEIKLLNKIHRGVDKGTDILSFPQTQIPTKEASLIGSIIIAPEVAIARGENLEELIKHGLLHLIGYDHDKNSTEWESAAIKINCTF